MQIEEIAVVHEDGERWEIVGSEPGEADDTVDFIAVPLGTRVKRLTVEAPAAAAEPQGAIES